jgi:hypothetical protein
MNKPGQLFLPIQVKLPTNSQPRLMITLLSSPSKSDEKATLEHWGDTYYCNPDCPLFCAKPLHSLCRDQIGRKKSKGLRYNFASSLRSATSIRRSPDSIFETND